MKYLTAILLATILLGCGSQDVRRVRVFDVNVVSKDGKGFVHAGPVYSVGMLTRDGEQMWMMSVHKMQVGMDVCVEWYAASGWVVLPCSPEHRDWYDGVDYITAQSFSTSTLRILATPRRKR